MLRDRRYSRRNLGIATCLGLVRDGASENAAEFGDQYGVVNALFTGLAFLFLLFSVYLQSRDVEIAREDLKAQSRLLASQQYEAGFWGFLAEYRVARGDCRRAEDQRVSDLTHSTDNLHDVRNLSDRIDAAGLRYEYRKRSEKCSLSLIFTRFQEHPNYDPSVRLEGQLGLNYHELCDSAYSYKQAGVTSNADFLIQESRYKRDGYARYARQRVQMLDFLIGDDPNDREILLKAAECGWAYVSEVDSGQSGGINEDAMMSMANNEQGKYAHAFVQLAVSRIRDRLSVSACG